MQMDHIKGFRPELLQEGKSRHTVNNYLQAVLEYKSYVQNRYERPFSAESMDEESVEYFKEYLLYITMSKPNVINNKLSALKRLAAYLINSTATRTPYFGEWAVHVATDGSR
jgi:site-specific recombinase XerD